MEKTHKSIFIVIAGALCCATCILSCGTLKGVESRAFATETDNSAWYTWLAGGEIEVDQTAGLDAYGATIWTDSIPLPDKLAYKAINGVSTQHLTYDGESQYVTQQVLAGKLEYRLRIGPQGNPPFTYAQEIRIRSDIVQTVVAEQFFYSVQNTTFGVPTAILPGYGVKAQLTFDYYNTTARVWETYAHTKSTFRTNGDGNFYVTEAGKAEDLLTAMRERNAIVKTSGTDIEVMHIRHIVLTFTRETQEGERTVFCQLAGDTFSAWNYFGRDNVTLNTYIARIDSYNPYDTYRRWEGETGLFDFVDTFFTTDIAPGFSIGTLLFLGVGALLVGLLLKIFLGG